MTAHGPTTEVEPELSECKIFDTLAHCQGSCDSHISYLNLLEREPTRLRCIGVDSTVKLAERRSLDTALLEQAATVVRQFAHLP